MISVRVCLVVILSLVSSSQVFSAVQPDDIIFYASMDATAKPQIARGRDVVRIEGTERYKPGQRGQALLCGESGAVCWYKTQDNIHPESGTLEMWFKSLDWGLSDNSFHVWFEAKNPGWLLLYKVANKKNLTFLVGKTMQDYQRVHSPSNVIEQGDWRHIIATWEAGEIRLYINGKFCGHTHTTEVEVPEGVGKDFRIGDRGWGKPRLGGRKTLIDEVRIYSRALQPIEIDEIWQARSASGAVKKPKITMASSPADEPVSERPHQLVRENRTTDTHPPLVDFEDLQGWTIETEDANAKASLRCSRKWQLWGKYMGEVAYRGKLNNEIIIRPPQPMPIANKFDAVYLYLLQDHGVIPLNVYILLGTPEGKELRVKCGKYLTSKRALYHREAKIQQDELNLLDDGATFNGICIINRNLGQKIDSVDLKLYLDNLAVYKEKLPPLTFDPRPRPGIDLFPGQSYGLNTGPGRLPFPTRKETILPDNLTRDFKTSVRQEGTSYIFTYQGDDGILEYLYTPRTGTLGDITVTWGKSGTSIEPLLNGGVRVGADAEQETSQVSQKLIPVSCRIESDAVISKWKLKYGQKETEVIYTIRLWQKSLVVDTKCLGGGVSEFIIGTVKGLANPRLVHLPYLVGAKGRFPDKRPAVVVGEDGGSTLFVTALMDYYKSNASELIFENKIDVDKNVAVCNGGTRYIPKTDGIRNDCYERLFLTVSPKFEEVLPNIPNPKSPWMHLTGAKVFTPLSHASDDDTYNYWLNMSRYGINEIITWGSMATWRGQEITGAGELRTEAAPQRGGADSVNRLADRLRQLGIIYGVYNCYTDIRGVSRFWDEDYVSRNPDGSWKVTYNLANTLKYGRGVELQAKLAPIKRDQFPDLGIVYSDVITANPFWEYTDYDRRVPGAGRFISAFYAYGELLRNESLVMSCPTISEGRNHYYYSGIVDVNYAQDKYYFCFKDRPWLVDFDLKKMHPLGCNFGMGFPRLGFFYLDKDAKDLLSTNPDVRNPKLDKFLAATIAFGHSGMLVRYGPRGNIENAVRSYFMVQQLAKIYTQETAVDIRYADKQGRLYNTTDAVTKGVYKRSQVWTKYSSGLEVWVNGNRSKVWKTENAVLPPYGYFAKSADGELVVFSALKDGHRADYVESAAYIYIDGRGKLVKFKTGASDGIMIVLKQKDNSLKIIPVGAKNFGISARVGTKDMKIIAFSKDGMKLGPASTRLEKGIFFIEPTEGAFSYVVRF